MKDRMNTIILHILRGIETCENTVCVRSYVRLAMSASSSCSTSFSLDERVTCQGVSQKTVPVAKVTR